MAVDTTHMRVAIVAIAKLESLYIEEWVRYHLGIGVDHIYLYDNEDSPTYASLLGQYAPNLTVIHFPGNSYSKGVQYVALDDFTQKRMNQDKNTHVAHIDIDEFIALKRHVSIKDFIREFIKEKCAGIGMSWRFFGSSGHTDYTAEPVTLRFTNCQRGTNKHIKTLFDVRRFISYGTCHDVRVQSGFSIQDTTGRVINGPFNPNGPNDVIQLNHYKSKTLPEFTAIRKRGSADHAGNRQPKEDIIANFNTFNVNDEEDTTARDFYMRILTPPSNTIRQHS